MKKIKLNLNDLKIESFETSAKTKSKGTVVGNTLNTMDQCGQSNINLCTLDQTCFKTVIDDECTTRACPSMSSKCPTHFECPEITIQCPTIYPDCI